MSHPPNLTALKRSQFFELDLAETIFKMTLFGNNSERTEAFIDAMFESGG